MRQVIEYYIFRYRYIMISFIALMLFGFLIYKYIERLNFNGVFKELKHDLLSFRQGIRFNIRVFSLALFSELLFDFIRLNIIYTAKPGGYKLTIVIILYTILCLVQKFFIIWLIITTSLTIYTITEIKHLCEYQDNKQISSFLKMYVVYGIVCFALEVNALYHINVLSPVLIVSCVLITTVIVVLGMADVLNNYKKERHKELKNIINLFKSTEDRKRAIKSLGYNIKLIISGTSLLLRDTNY
ncbi:MAG: hypothetical protein Q8936_06635 [Bacillota bacterium]|nr:hypothetical protein [Bacillota bacterium]